MKFNRFARYAWGVLIYNIAVILWGASVRATGSGAGCGNHWPLCQGSVIPQFPQLATLIEFSHRISTGIASFLVLGLVVWACRRYPRKHIVRFGAWSVLLFIFLEALVGAAQVRLELVANNTSIARAFIGTIHLMNTFFLIAAMTLTAWWASGGKPMQLRGQGLLGWLYGLGIIATLVLGASGAITALVDTLFPVNSLAQGFQQDFSPAANFLIHLRIFHPVIAIMTGAYLIFITFLAHAQRPHNRIKPFAQLLSALFMIQLIVGTINIALLTPVWIQLTHLLLADLVWITLVLATAATFARQEPSLQYAETPPMTEAQVT